LRVSWGIGKKLFQAALSSSAQQKHFMQGVAISRKVFPTKSKDKVGDFFTYVFGIPLIVAACLVIIPLGLVLWLIISIYNYLAPRDENQQHVEEKWNVVETAFPIEIGYKYVDAATASGAASGYFDSQPLMVFKVAPENSFFAGYFSDFVVERTDGLFVQKVCFDAAMEEVQTMSLYFFKYETQVAEEIADLKDYEINSKGNSDDFIITATGEEDEIQIRLTNT
jgi:hypothetical protein